MLYPCDKSHIAETKDNLRHFNGLPTSKKLILPKVVFSSDSQLDPEIEKSLYYLGKALFRYNLLLKERRSK